MTWERLAVATVSPSIGQLSPIGVARGAYTEITEIVAPDSAAEGERVDVTVKVKNIDTYWDHVIACVAVVDGLRFIDEVVIIPSGGTYSYSGAFLMGGGNVTIYAYTYYPEPYAVPTVWIEDDRAQKDVALAEVYAGTIIGIELEHNGAQEGLPVYNIPQGQTARVHVWGRNDMATVQRLGIHWLVRDPDGILVEDYEDWSTLYYRQGADHEFLSERRFNLDKPGTYTINIALSMNPADPEIVDSYYGTLCAVAAEAPPEVWVKLATKAITLTPEVVELVWEKLAEKRVTITPEAVELVWEKLAEKQVTITPEVVELVWEKLAEKQVTITPEVVEEVWEKLAEKQVMITPEVEVPPEYIEIQHTIYPWSYVFEGDAETCIFEFKVTPEQIPGTEWLGQRIVDSFASELEKEGAKLLELKVSRDTTPIFWTNYRVEVTATASPLAWNLIIIGVLAVLFVIAIVFAIKAVESLVYHRKTLDEETKKTFSRDTLTAMILDLSPETPSETLDGMEDQELRDLLNQLLAEIAPPISPWAIIALIGGVGVLGVGAAVALGAARPGE